MPFLRSRDCYSRPEDVYRVAKARGMDLVAITDHDTIDGALELLDRRPDATDIIVGEEVSCRLPDGDLEVHLGVYGMTEALHRDVQRLRRNVFDVAARLREARVFFALNHLLHFYHPRTPLDVYLRLLEEVPALEVRNGAMLAEHNRLIERMAARWRPPGAAPLAAVAGSDAHTLRRVGTTWTEAPGRDRDEFLRSVRDGPRASRRARRHHVHGRRRRLRRHRPVRREPGGTGAARPWRPPPRGVPGVHGGVPAVSVSAAGDRAGGEVARAANRPSGRRTLAEPANAARRSSAPESDPVSDCRTGRLRGTA